MGGICCDMIYFICEELFYEGNVTFTKSGLHKGNC